jgi:hypothetical protein
MIASVWLDSYRRLLNLRAAIWSGHALLVAWWLCHAQWRSRASKGYELDGAEQCRGTLRRLRSLECRRHAALRA